MKSTRQFIVIVFAFMISTLLVVAQTPQEQLQPLVTQLKTTPTDNSLREKIIKLAVTMKPSPEIPEDARRPFVRGNTAIKEATGPDDYANAIKLYLETLALAPWWGDAYFNLAKGQELHQDYDAAIQSTKFFLMTSPPATEARDAQDHIYALEEKRDKKLASDKVKAAADAENAKQSEIKAQEQRIIGTWQASLRAPDRYIIQFLEFKHQPNGDWSILESAEGSSPSPWMIRDVHFVNSELKFVKPDNPACVGAEVLVSPSSDGSKLSLYYTPIHSDVWDNSCAERVQAWEMKPFVREYTRTR